MIILFLIHIYEIVLIEFVKSMTVVVSKVAPSSYN